MLFKRNFFIEISKGKTVDCPISALFDVLNDNMRQGLCTDIHFEYKNQKYDFGAYGDNGQTFNNVTFYCGKFECRTKEELMNYILPDGSQLSSLQGNVTVSECNGCYPKSTPILAAFLNENEP